MPEVTLVEATRLAVAQEMRRDPRVWVLGEDVARGGLFGQYRGFPEEFGEARAVSTPISESTIMGAGLGAALVGTRPVIEMRIFDFTLCAMDELVSQIAKARYMFGGQGRAALVVRMPQGMWRNSAAQHSQCLEAWLTHVPGLKAVMPSTAADAAGLLRSAIADPNPVVYVENKTPYFRKEEAPAQPAAVPLGRARIARPGRDVTIVALSRLVSESLAAAAELAAEGIEAEVIDPRTLVPLDLDAIVESVARTHRVVVAHEAVLHGGFGAEVAARLQDAAFDELDAPIARVGAPFAPVPFSPPLEDAYLPGRDDVTAVVRGLLGR